MTNNTERWIMEIMNSSKFHEHIKNFCNTLSKVIPVDLPDDSHIIYSACQDYMLEKSKNKDWLQRLLNEKITYMKDTATKECGDNQECLDMENDSFIITFFSRNLFGGSITPEKIKQLVDDYKNKKVLERIVKKYELKGRDPLSFGLRDLYEEKKKKKIKEEIEKLIEEGLDVTQMAERTGVASSTISKSINDLGLREQYERKMEEEKEKGREEYTDILQSCVNNLPQKHRESCILTCYPILEMVKSLNKKFNLPNKVLNRAKDIVKHSISNSWFNEFFGKNRIGLAGTILYASAKLEGEEKTFRTISKSIGVASETLRKNLKIIRTHYKYNLEGEEI